MTTKGKKQLTKAQQEKIAEMVIMFSPRIRVKSILANEIAKKFNINLRQAYRYIDKTNKNHPFSLTAETVDDRIDDQYRFLSEQIIKNMDNPELLVKFSKQRSDLLTEYRKNVIRFNNEPEDRTDDLRTAARQIFGFFGKDVSKS